MKNKIFLYLITSPLLIFSQNKEYLISYDLIKINSSKNIELELLVKENKSLFKIKNPYEFTFISYGTFTTKENGVEIEKKLDTTYKKEIAKDETEKNKFKKYYIGHIVYKDFSKNKLIANYSTFFYKDTTPVLDTLNNFNWKYIKDTTKIINGNICKLATTLWRGRFYYAWYCTKIPIHDGPSKFNGLPGLILEIYDNENFVKYTCTKITKTSTELKIELPEKYYKFDEFYSKSIKGYRKMMELIKSQNSINADCTTCGDSKPRINIGKITEVSIQNQLEIDANK